MTFKTNMITERQRAVLETMRMKLTERLALAYLKGEGFPMSDTTLYREKRKLEQMKLKRLYNIAQIGFQDQHMQTIDEYEMGFRMMWQNVLRETDPYKQNSMIRDILALKPYLSAYYEATKYIVEKPTTITNRSSIIIDESNNNGESAIEPFTTEEQIEESNNLSTIKRDPQEPTRNRFTDPDNRKF